MIDIDWDSLQWLPYEEAEKITYAWAKSLLEDYKILLEREQS